MTAWQRAHLISGHNIGNRKQRWCDGDISPNRSRPLTVVVSVFPSPVKIARLGETFHQAVGLVGHPFFLSFGERLTLVYHLVMSSSNTDITFGNISTDSLVGSFWLNSPSIIASAFLIRSGVISTSCTLATWLITNPYSRARRYFFLLSDRKLSSFFIIFRFRFCSLRLNCW